MRSSRLIAILVALMFAAILPMAAAQATIGTSAGTTTEKARTPHVVKHYSKGTVRGTDNFFVKGQVVTFPNKFIKLQKKKCGKCAYKPFRQQRTSKAGSFKFVFDARIGDCFRLFIPGTTKNSPTYKTVGCIVRV